jgi:CBS domain-containing protein
MKLWRPRWNGDHLVGEVPVDRPTDGGRRIMANLTSEFEGSGMSRGSDESYYDPEPSLERRVFDARLLQAPLTVLSSRSPIVCAESTSIADAMHAMQEQHRGCVLVTADGTTTSELTGIFTERDIMLRVIQRGRNPATIPLREVMSRNPERLPMSAQVAWVLNMMAVGGFRHVPVVNAKGCPVGVISVRDVVGFLVEAFPTEILNLPPDFGRGTRVPRDGA